MTARFAEPTRNAIAYVGEHGTKALVAGVVGILVGRYLGPSQFGLLNYTLSLFGIAATLAQLEIRPILVRELAAGTEERRVLVASAISRQIPAAIALSLMATAVLLWTRGTEGDALFMAALLLPYPLLALADTLRAALEVEGVSRLIVRTTLLAASVSAVFRVTAILMTSPVWVFAAATTLEFGLVGFGLSRRWASRGVMGRVRESRSRVTAHRLLRESWKLFLASLAIVTFMRIDIAMLGLISGDLAAGVYTAAARLSELWYFIPMAALAALRPRLARIYSEGDTHLYATLTQRFITSGFWVAALVALIMLVAADWVVVTLFGQSFADAGAVLRVHILAAPFVFVGVASGQWLIDNRLTGHVVLQTTTGAVLNVGLNLVLIPRYGPMGAAISTLVAYAVATVIVNATRRATRPLFRMQLRSIFVRWR